MGGVGQNKALMELFRPRRVVIYFFFLLFNLSRECCKYMYRALLMMPNRVTADSDIVCIVSVTVVLWILSN